MINYIKVFDGDYWNYWKIYEDRGLARFTEDPYDIEWMNNNNLNKITKLRTRTVEEYLKSKYKNVKEHPKEWIFTFNPIGDQ